MGGAGPLNLLLDTHIWLWSRLDPGQIGAGLRTALEDPGVELWLSPISVWEAKLAFQRGRIESRQDPADWIRSAFVTSPLRDAPLTREVALVSRTIELAHDDPADRFLAASAIVHDLVLATADERLLASTQFASLPNR